MFKFFAHTILPLNTQLGVQLGLVQATQIPVTYKKSEHRAKYGYILSGQTTRYGVRFALANDTFGGSHGRLRH